METFLVFVGIIGLLAIGLFAFIFLGLFLKICLLRTPIVFSFLLPATICFFLSLSFGGLGILVGIGASYVVFENWEDHLVYQNLVKKIDGIFQTGCAERKISEICNGKRGISASFAIELEKVFGISAEFWVTMQAKWNLYIARQKAA